jgi:hypothetical protein
LPTQKDGKQKDGKEWVRELIAESESLYSATTYQCD